MKKIISILLVGVFSIGQVVSAGLLDTQTLRPLSSSLNSVYIQENTVPSPFKNPEVNQKLSQILTYWAGKLNLDPIFVRPYFPDKEKQLTQLEEDILSLKEGDASSVAATNIAKKVLILDIYKKLLDIYATTGKIPVVASKLMGLVYSPGVGWVCRDLYVKPGRFYDFVKTNRYRYIYKNGSLQDVKNMPGKKRDVPLYVVTDGTATLGIKETDENSVTVMFGKTILFQNFGGEDLKADICYVDTKKAREAKNQELVIQTIVNACKAIREKNPKAAIMLEDISAPVCFEVEKRLNQAGIFTIHDDQWGTSIVVAAGIINTLKLLGKKPVESTVVMSGAGASAVAVARVLRQLGIGKIIAFDTKGAIYNGRPGGLTPQKQELADMNKDNFKGDMKEALKYADLFIGLSEPALFWGQEEEMLSTMGTLCEQGGKVAVFACANPDPEFNLFTIKELQRQGKLSNIAFIGGGAFGNPGTTLNNSTAFPGLYAALTHAVREGKLKLAKDINIAELAYACAQAVASVWTEKDLKADSILPRTFTDEGYNFKITQAVATAAWQVLTGESEAQAKKEFEGLPDNLKKEQQQTISELKGLNPELKKFLSGLIDLLGGPGTNIAVQEMLKNVTLGPSDLAALIGDLSKDDKWEESMAEIEKIISDENPVFSNSGEEYLFNQATIVTQACRRLGYSEGIIRELLTFENVLDSTLPPEKQTVPTQTWLEILKEMMLEALEDVIKIQKDYNAKHEDKIDLRTATYMRSIQRIVEAMHKHIVITDTPRHNPLTTHEVLQRETIKTSIEYAA